MKANKSKKGFTLVEIIATVAILGVLSVIGIASVNNVIERGKKEHYKSAEKTIKMAAESYTQTNRNYLPKNVGEKKQVFLNQLEENNYIEEVRDYYDKKCYSEQSYVQIFKYSKTDYSYITYLKCPNYSNDEQVNEGEPTITISMTNPSYNNVKNTSAGITIEDNKKLLSYSITIYKNGKEIYTTGNVNANYEKKIQKTYDISKYTPATIKVVVKAINIYGLDTTKSSEKSYSDTQAPECIISADNANISWTNKDRKITVGCNDGEEGSGCARETFTKTFTEDAQTGYIEIKDKAGNTTQCKVNVYLDKTKPSCTLNLSNLELGTNNWYIKPVTVKLTSSDSRSGIRYKSLTTSSTAPTSASGYNGTTSVTQNDTKGTKWYGYIEDYAGNKVTCSSKQIKVDATSPTKPSGGSINISGSASSKTLGVVSGSTDATSGIKEYRYYVRKNTSTYPSKDDKNFTTSRSFTRSCGTSYYAYAIAVDNAGNKSPVYRINIAKDGSNSYSSWSSCSKSCGTGTQTRTNTCALITTNLSRSCNTQSCCSKVTYKNGTTCSKKCGSGTYNRLAYSYYDGSRCSSKDLSSGGSACNTQSCCSKVTYKNGTTCSNKCGPGTYNRLAYSYYDGSRCSSKDSSSGGSACSTSTRGETSGWGKCSAKCKGTQTRTIKYYSVYDGSYCSQTVQTRNCGTDCCSEENPYGCDWVTSCREGQTAIFTTSAATKFAGRVYHYLNGHSDKLYILGTSGALTKVYADSGDFFYNNNNKVVWIYSNCLGPKNKVCPYTQCPG